MRKVTIWALFLALMLCLCGCHSTERRPTAQNSEATEDSREEETPLVIFDMTRDSNIFSMNYKAAYPEAAVEFHKVSNMADGIAKWGEPDIILCESRGYVEELMKAGDALDLTNLYDCDNEIDLDLYYPDVMEAGRFDDNFCAIPLGLESHFITVSDSHYAGSAFESLGEDYTYMQVLDAMLDECDKAEQEGRAGIGGDPRNYAWFFESGAITYENGEAKLDQEFFARVLELFQKAQQESITYGMTIGSMGSTKDYDKFSFLIRGKDYFNSASPQEWLVYENSYVQDRMQEGVHVFWLPIMGENNAYAAWVGQWGLIGAGSTKPEEAYACLRQMMDTPVTLFHNYSMQYFPVNREQALAMIDAAQVSDYYRMMDGEQILKSPLPNELRTDLENYLTHITKLCADEMTPEIVGIGGFVSGMDIYQMDTATAYDRMQQILNE